MTQEEILRPRFGPSGRGVYRISDVENHLSRVSEYCSSLIRKLEESEKENRDLNEKLGILTEKLEEYKDEEENIKLTLLNAQRMAAKMKKDSEAQREELMEEARSQRDGIIESARKRALSEINEMKAKNEAYVTDTVSKADEYFSRAKYEYETKTAEAEAKAAETLHDAAKKAEYIISESRIRAAAAVEKANATIAHIKDDNSDALLAMQREMSTIRNLVMNYKDEISAVLTRNMELIEGIEEPESISSIFDNSVFEPISSEINDEVPENYKEKKNTPDIFETVKEEPAASKESYVPLSVPETIDEDGVIVKVPQEVKPDKVFTLDSEMNAPADETDDDPFASILATVAAENRQAEEEKSQAYVQAELIYKPAIDRREELKTVRERTKVFDPLKADDPDSLEFGAGFNIFDEDLDEPEQTDDRGFFQKHKKRK